MGWITGAVENLMNTNEANKAAAAQRKIAEANLRDVWTCDMRYLRAQMLTSCIMQVVGRHICDHTDRDPD